MKSPIQRRPVRPSTLANLVLSLMLTVSVLVVTLSTASAASHSGSWSLKGVLPSSAGFSNTSQAPTGIASSSTYVASIWLQGTGSVQLYIKNGNWGGTTLASVQCTAGASWTQCTTPSFSTGSNTQLTYILQNSYAGAGTIWLDDAFLGPSGGANKLANAGFESGNTTWTISNSAVWSIVQTASPTSTPTPSTCSTIRVETGNTSSYTDSSGQVWSADTGATGGSTVDRGNIAIANTNDPRIYQTEHYGMSGYHFNVANCTYTVSLHFAETFFTSSGQRVFNVAIGGATVLSNFDVFVAAGGANKALVKTFTTTVSNGGLDIGFTAVTNNAEINGIQVIPGGTGPTPTPIPTPTPAPSGYHVSGNSFYDSNNARHRFHGVARSGLEVNCSDSTITAADFQHMKSWNANVVRLALNQDYWLSGAARFCSSYQTNVDNALNQAIAAGLDVIFDLHWSDKGNLGNTSPAQQRMADANSVTFWQQFATKYKNNPHIIFELYNEPHDVSWSVWKSGGDSGDGFTVHGMQELYNTVRGTGANNIILIAGLNWGYDLSGVPSNRITGFNIGYITHPYDFAGKQPSDWDAGWGFLTTTDPVIVTEFGDFNCTAGYYTSLINYAESHNQTSWTAWAWTPSGCGFPSLLADWSGTPSSPVGVTVKNALLAMPAN